MKNFTTEIGMTNYLRGILNFEPNVSIVCTRSYLDEVVSEIELDCKSFTREIDNDEYIYLIDKYSNENGDIYLDICPIEFDDDGCMETEIFSDIVVIQEYLLDVEDIEDICTEELITINFGDSEEECNCEGCNGCEINELSDIVNNISNRTKEAMFAIGEAVSSIFPRIIEQEMENKLTEFEEMLEESDDEDICIHCSIKQMLVDTYMEAYYSGVESGKATITEELEELLDRVTE